MHGEPQARVFALASIATLNFKPISSSAIHLCSASETGAIFTRTLCRSVYEKRETGGKSTMREIERSRGATSSLC